MESELCFFILLFEMWLYRRQIIVGDYIKDDYIKLLHKVHGVFFAISNPNTQAEYKYICYRSINLIFFQISSRIFQFITFFLIVFFL